MYVPCSESAAQFIPNVLEIAIRSLSKPEMNFVTNTLVCNLVCVFYSFIVCNSKLISIL